MIYRLIFLTSLKKGTQVTIEQREMIIGRDVSCDISVPDDLEIGSSHAAIKHCQDDTLSIRDLGSMSNLLVNNHAVNNTRLKHGDVLEIGRTRFLVQASVQAEIRPGVPAKRSRKKIALAKTIGTITFFFALTLILTRHCRKEITVDENTLPTVQLDEKPLIPPDVFKDIPAVDIEKNRNDVLPKKDAEPRQETNSQEAITPPHPHVQQPTPKPPPQPVRPPVIQIGDIEQQKFPDNEAFDEMRVITFVLTAEPSKTSYDETKLEIFVRFFDKDSDTSKVVPSRSVTPLKPITPTSLFKQGKEIITVPYNVSKGMRTSQTDSRAGMSFYGVVLEINYNGEIVARKARPKSLLAD